MGVGFDGGSAYAQTMPAASRVPRVSRTARVVARANHSSHLSCVGLALSLVALKIPRGLPHEGSIPSPGTLNVQWLVVRSALSPLDLAPPLQFR